MNDGKQGEALNLTVKSKKERDLDSGSRVEAFTDVLRRQVVNSLWITNADTKETGQQKIIASMTGMLGLSPKDEVEGMLAAQMVALHNAAMECYRRAMLSNQTFEGRESSLKHGAKLSRTYASLMETMDRHRGKNVSEQKVTVEHVHVHAGGQAIVGAVANTGGAVGVNSKRKGQSHANRSRTLENCVTESMVMPTMRSENPERDALSVSSHE